MPILWRRPDSQGYIRGSCQHIMSALTGPEVLRNLEAALRTEQDVSGLLSGLPLQDLTVLTQHLGEDDTALDRFFNAALMANIPAPETELEFSSFWGAPAPENDVGFVSEESEESDDDLTLSDDEPMDVD